MTREAASTVPPLSLRLAAGAALPVLLAGFVAPAPPQLQALFKTSSIVRAAPETPLVSVTPGETIEVPVRVEITRGYHINAARATFDYMIPTRLEWGSSALKMVKVDYPPAGRRTFSFTDKPLEVYEGTVAIRTKFQAPPNAVAGKLTLAGKLRYQACDDKACYPPGNVAVEVAVQVLKKRVRNS